MFGAVLLERGAFLCNEHIAGRVLWVALETGKSVPDFLHKAYATTRIRASTFYLSGGGGVLS